MTDLLVDGTNAVTSALLGLARARSDNDVLEALDETAEAIVAADLTHRFIGFADQLRTINFDHHPWAALPAGVALCPTAPEQGRRVLERAITDFEALGDDRGLGLACFVLGNEELAWGRVREADELWQRAHALLDGTTPADGLALAHRALAAYMDGQLLGAFRLAEEALHAARMQRNVRAEATAAVYVGFLCWWVGDFAGLHRAMESADVALAAIEDPLDRYELPLAILGHAVIAVARGALTEGDALFDTAIDVATSMENAWYVAILRTIRAELLARVDLTRALADAQAALKHFRDAGETWWSYWALLSLAVVQREAGLLHAARNAIDEVLASDLNAFERGRALLAAGEIAAAAGERDRAARELSAAVEALAAVGADFWAARAEVALAGIDTKRTAYLLRSATRRAGTNHADLGWRRVLRGSATVHIQVLGSPEVRINGLVAGIHTELDLKAVCVLTVAGPSGMHAAQLAETLWPGTDASEVSHRLDVLLSGIRQKMLPAARLIRKRGVVSLDVDDDECDLRTLMAEGQAALRAGSTRSSDEVERISRGLAVPVCGGGIDEWVVDQQQQVDALRSAFEQRFAAPARPTTP